MTEAKLKTFKKVLGVPRFKIASNERYNPEIRTAQISTSRDAYEYLTPLYHEDMEIREVFYILLLNRANKVIGVHELSKGGMTGTVVDATLVGFVAINTLSKGIILCHNHPSGNLKPSDQDRKITQEIKHALSLFHINVIDHLILTENGYFSFADEGII